VSDLTVHDLPAHLGHLEPVQVPQGLGRRGHPALVAVRSKLEQLRNTDIYQVGVQMILDAVEASARG